MKASRWRAVDKETMDLVRLWLHENETTVSIRKLAVYLGCSESRLYRMLNYNSTPLSLAEFTKVCQIFGKNPDEEFSRILKLSNLTSKKDPPQELFIHRIEEALADYHRSNEAVTPE